MTQLDSGGSGPPDAPYQRPMAAPCKELPFTAPLGWLRDGYRDFRAAPGLSLAWGGFCWLLSVAVTWLGWKLGGSLLLLGMLTGFVFVAPLLTFGMYSVSRKLCMGTKPTLAGTLRAVRRPVANSLTFALVLIVIFLLWARAASMVHIFFPAKAHANLGDLGIYLAVGTAVGAVFALVTFSASVFSLPFIANRDVDTVTAVISSINAVLRNRWTMLFWAAIVATFTAVGFATALFGFVFIIPWLGYATWHGYRETLVVDSWETLPVAAENGAGQ